MKRSLTTQLVRLFTVLISAVTFSSLSAGEGWMTDFAAAQEKAKSEGKPLLAEFTGSDWCPPCKMLKKEVLDNSTFKEYAAENLVLVMLDFPRQKEQSAELKAQNEGLAKKYGVQGFPTLILFSPDGKVLGEPSVGFKDLNGIMSWLKSTAS